MAPKEGARGLLLSVLFWGLPFRLRMAQTVELTMIAYWCVIMEVNGDVLDNAWYNL